MLTLLAVLAAVWFARLPASANAETCPASVSDLYAAGDSASLFGFQIEARTVRSVTGNLAVETDRGWYRVPFRAPALAKTVRHYANDSSLKPFAAAVFASPTLYVHFPGTVIVRNAWVENAAVTGETGWKEGVSVICYPTWPAYARASNFVNHLDADGTATMSAAPSVATSISEAQPVPPIETTSCAKPFADATALKVVAPQYPYRQAMPDGMTLIEVTVMPNGSLGDVSVYKSSGDVAYDIAAMESAERSTYSPKIAYCRPGIGEYLFRARFMSR